MASAELYYEKISSMNDCELSAEYMVTIICRQKGGDLCFDLGMRLDLLAAEALSRDLKLPNLSNIRPIFGHIRQIDTPESKSLQGYGYDYYAHTVYIKYNSGDKIYAFEDVPTDRFKQFESSESKGKEAAMLRKEFASKE